MAEKGNQKCFGCQSGNIVERQHKGMFLYGHELKIALWVEHPFLECDDCGECWTDYRAEDAREEAVKKLLNVENIEEEKKHVE